MISITVIVFFLLSSSYARDSSTVVFHQALDKVKLALSKAQTGKEVELREQRTKNVRTFNGPEGDAKSDASNSDAAGFYTIIIYADSACSVGTLFTEQVTGVCVPTSTSTATKYTAETSGSTFTITIDNYGSSICAGAITSTSTLSNLPNGICLYGTMSTYKSGTTAPNCPFPAVLDTYVAYYLYPCLS